ncbi:MAG: hypothetical protein ACREC6_14695 [Hyphomicrobiaceae bacterium]
MTMDKRWLAGAAGALAMLVGSTAVSAQGTAPAAPLDPKLEARLNAEKEGRKQCKIDLCKILSTGKTEAPTVTCDITKTWLDKDIQDALANKFEWRWGHAQCSAKVDLDGALLAKLRTQSEMTAKFKKHDLKCTLDQKGGTGEPYNVKLSVVPEVTFKGGKATKAVMTWSDLDAPLLVKSALWSATAVDSAFNIASGTMVEQINGFMFSKCKEVGIEIAQPK